MERDDEFFMDMRALGGHSRVMDVIQTHAERGLVEMRMDWQPHFAADAEGTVASTGPILSIIDSASGSCVYTQSTSWPLVTLDMRVDYARPQRPGTPLFAVARCDGVNHRRARVTCDVHDGDPADPVARSVLAFFILEAE